MAQRVLPSLLLIRPSSASQRSVAPRCNAHTDTQAEMDSLKLGCWESARLVAVFWFCPPSIPSLVFRSLG